MEADKLFNQHTYTELYDLLIQYKVNLLIFHQFKSAWMPDVFNDNSWTIAKDSENADILWRLARATHKLTYSTSSAAEVKKLHYEAYGYVEKALKLDPDNYAVHKWLFVLLDAKASHEGLKVRILESPNVKKHIIRACELNPMDPTSFHFLGFWSIFSSQYLQCGTKI